MKRLALALSISLMIPAVLFASVAGGDGGPRVEASAYKPCKGLKDVGPTGSDPADVKGLRARNVSCAQARRVALQWLKPVGNRNEGGLKKFGAWACADTIAAKQRVRCKARGGKRVRFYLG